MVGDTQPPPPKLNATDSPLHAAVRDGHYEDVLRVIREKEVPTIEVRNENGDTALHVAVQLGHAACVELLLEAGANPVSLNKSGNTPLQIALSSCNNELEDMLRDALAESGGHYFRVASFRRLTWCPDCTRFLWGFRNQGMLCANCFAITCRRCVSFAVVRQCEKASTSAKPLGVLRRALSRDLQHQQVLTAHIAPPEAGETYATVTVTAMNGEELCCVRANCGGTISDVKGLIADELGSKWRNELVLSDGRVLVRGDDEKPFAELVDEHALGVEQPLPEDLI